MTEDTLLSQTLTNVVIPTYDVLNLKPTIFSSYQINVEPTLDVRLADICIATSAAPTYLPAHYFEKKDEQGRVKQYNLIDGGVCANNPTLVAIREVMKDMIRLGKSGNGIGYDRFIVISIGTGVNKLEQWYNAKMVANWGVLSWLYKSGATPILDFINESSIDMVEYHNSVLFTALHSQDNYLRIQEDSLPRIYASSDVTTEDNLNGLVKVGQTLLKKSFTRVSLDTGEYEAVPNKGSIEEELTRFAKLLSEIRKEKMAKSKSQSGM
jgi:patatin-like phospholipase/acyl hydrolase